jgi:hypothetical protein
MSDVYGDVYGDTYGAGTTGGIVNRTATVAESTTGTSITGTLPADRQAGDLVVATFHMDTSVFNFAGPSGWTVLCSATSNGSGQVVAAYYRFDPPSAPTATTAGAGGRLTCLCQAYGGVDTGTPVDAAAVTAVSATAPLTIGQVTTVTNGARLVSGITGNFSTVTWTQPTGMTLVKTNTSGVGRGGALADEARATAGVTGTRAWTASTTTAALAGFLAALRPATAVTPAAKAATLTDTFHTLDTVKWPGRTSSAYVAGWRGRVVMPGTVGPSEKWSTETVRYDLTGSYFGMEWAELPTATAAVGVHAIASYSPENRLMIGREAGNLLMRRVEAGNVSDTTLAYDPLAHRWVRLTHDGTNVLWQTSSNGLTWTTRRTAVTTIDLTSVYLTAEATWQGTVGTGRFAIANVNTAPVTPLTYNPPPYTFGTLRTINDTYTDKADDEYAGGNRVGMYEVFWDRAEGAANGTFSSSYGTQITNETTTIRNTGLRLTLGLGLTYPPTWTSTIANYRLVNESGSNSTQLNYVFNQLVRDEVEDYFDWVNTRVGFTNCWAIRINAGTDGELLYPSGGLWGYDNNAKGTASNRPATIGPSPYPTWTPGTGTTTQAAEWMEWYLDALADCASWQMRYIRETYGYTGWFEILTPGVGTRPALLATEIANRLTGYSATTGVGAVWHKIYTKLAVKDSVVVYCSSMADNSAANDVPTTGDTAVALTSATAAAWSAYRYLVRIANEHGMPNSGENPGRGALADSYYQDVTSSGMMAKLLAQAAGGKALAVYWAHSEQLWGLSTLTFSDWATKIAALNLTGFTPTTPTATGTAASASVATSPGGGGGGGGDAGGGGASPAASGGTVRGYTLAADWSGTGTFTGPRENVTHDLAAEPELTISYGREESRPYGPMTAGSMSFGLLNVDRVFSPENLSSPLVGRIVPGRRVRLDYDAFPALTLPFTLPARLGWDISGNALYDGVIDRIPDIDMARPAKDFVAECLDEWGAVGGTKLSTAVYAGVRTGDAINVILDAVGWTGGRSVDPGATVIPYWWEDGTDAASALVRLVDSEGPPAIAYVEGGVFVFRDRHHRLLRDGSLTSNATFSHAVPAGTAPEGSFKVLKGYQYSHGLNDLVNAAAFEVTPRAPQSLTTVWSNGSPISLAPGEIRTLVVRTDDPFISAEVPSDEFGDYTIGGGGVSVVLSRTSGQSTLITLYGHATQGAYLTGMRLRAIPLTEGSAYRLEASANVPGQPWDRDAPWAGVHDADAITGMIVAMFSDRRPRVTFTIAAQLGSDYLTQVAGRRISDRIRLTLDDLGVDVDFIIEKIEHRIVKLGVLHEATFGCTLAGPEQPENLFTFDDADRGFDEGRFGVTGLVAAGRMFVFDDPSRGFGAGVFGI